LDILLESLFRSNQSRSFGSNSPNQNIAALKLVLQAGGFKIALWGM
jgi:hypothetical protein